MLQQFVNSILSQFNKIEPMNVYVQSIPEGVKYPCYLLNKCDIKTNALNSFYFVNTVTLYVRLFSVNEIELKNKGYNLVNTLFEANRKIPILNEDGTPTEDERFVRIEDIESIDISVDDNELYCVELNFSFDTTHKISVEEFDLLNGVITN